MNIALQLTDDAILAELGKRITHRRITQQLTQADLAVQSGVAKRTVERIEAGASAQLSSLIRIFRMLELLHDLDRLLPAAQPRPMELLKYRGKPRQRASKPRKVEKSGKGWTWAENDT